MRKKTAYFILFLLLAGVILWIFRSSIFPETPERAVKKVFAELETILAKRGTETLLVMAERTKSASRLFTDPSEIDLVKVHGGKKSYSKKELESLHLLLRKNIETFRFSFSDLELEFTHDSKECTVFFTGSFSGSVRGENSSVVREMKAQLVKKEKSWLIRTLEARPVLEK